MILSKQHPGSSPPCQTSSASSSILIQDVPVCPVSKKEKKKATCQIATYYKLSKVLWVLSNNHIETSLTKNTPPFKNKVTKTKLNITQ